MLLGAGPLVWRSALESLVGLMRSSIVVMFLRLAEVDFYIVLACLLMHCAPPSTVTLILAPVETRTIWDLFGRQERCGADPQYSRTL